MKGIKKAVRLPAAQRNTAGKDAKNAQETMVQAIAHDGGIMEDIVSGRQKTKVNFLFARNWGSYPLKDGRYLYEEWVNDGKKHYVIKKAYSGIRPEIFQYLTDTDRKDTNSQRKNKDHADADNVFQDGQEDAEGYFHRSAMDKAAYQQWIHRETWKYGDEDPIFPDDILKKQFVAGENKINNQRCKMRNKVICQFVERLTIKQRDAVMKYYGENMTEEAIANEEGVSKQAIDDRLTKEVKPALREVFTRLGIEVPTEEELREEMKRKPQRKAAMRQVDREWLEEKEEIRKIHAVASGKADLDTYIDHGKVKYTTSKDKMKEETYGSQDNYDSANAYESTVDEDYDPYEHSAYKQEEQKAAAEDALLWGEKLETYSDESRNSWDEDDNSTDSEIPYGCHVCNLDEMFEDDPDEMYDGDMDNRDG